MPVSEEEVAAQFPAHWLVWHDRHEELKQALQNNELRSEEMERKDPRGRTALLLAVTLGRRECVRALLDADADVNCEKDGWTAVQEATASGDAELLALVVARRDVRRHEARAAGVPALLRRLSLTPDFYVEMKWEFTSWVPLVSRLCPSDTYRVFKRGANVRVDTTLLGFHDNRWQRGDRTYIFTGHGDSAKLVELDHAAGTVWTEWLEGPGGARPAPAPAPRHLAHRLRTPLSLNYLDTDKICFERSKSGIWGWRQDKSEEVNGYECKVFSANNVELVSATRWEHVARGERRAARAPLAALLGDEPGAPVPPPPPPPPPPPSPQAAAAPAPPATWQRYFDAALEEARVGAVGRPQELSTRVQRFRATLWLCEDYPLQLQEQIMPILDLMASISSPHFVKLKDFIQMQLPAGFPVKIEIPLFHVMSARVTFGNLFGAEQPVAHVAPLAAGGAAGGPACLLDDAAFALGRGYRAASDPPCDDDDEQLLHYAIQQSLMEAGTQRDQVDVWEALRGARPAPPASPAAPAAPAPAAPPAPRDPPLAHDQAMLQRAIEESLASARLLPAPAARGERGGEGAEGEEVAEEEEEGSELRAALALSAAEQAARERLQLDEQSALERALQLSLLDK